MFKNRPPHLRHWLEQSAEFGDRDRVGSSTTAGPDLSPSTSARWRPWPTACAPASASAGRSRRRARRQQPRMGAHFLGGHVARRRHLRDERLVAARRDRLRARADQTQGACRRREALPTHRRPAHRRPGRRHRARLRRQLLGRQRRRRIALGRPASTRTIAVAILFTSGTTGRPKGRDQHASQPHLLRADLDAVGRSAAHCSSHDPPTRPRPTPTNVVCSSPLFHVSGLQSAAISGIAHGIRYIWTTGRFDPKQILEITAQREASLASAASPHRCGASSSIRTSTSTTSRTSPRWAAAGSVSPPNCSAPLREKLPNAAANFSVGYGLTECGGLCSMANYRDARSDNPDRASARRFRPPQIAIIDDEANRLPTGEVGNVCIKGPMVMPGYWDNADATADAFFPGRWLKSGDFGWIDDDEPAVPGDPQTRHDHPRRREHLSHRDRESPRRAPRRCRSRGRGCRPPHARPAGQGRRRDQVRPERQREARSCRLGRRDARVLQGARILWRSATKPLPRNATGKVMKHVLTGEAENTMIEE